MDLTTLLVTLVLASFAFTAGAYIFTFKMWRSLSHQIGLLWKQVTNHLAHDLDAIRERLSDLERRK